MTDHNNWLFHAQIDGKNIRCSITSPEDITAPVFCFSLMAPGKVIAGGEMIKTLAGYCEVALPDLRANEPHSLVLAHANPIFVPANRAWLPLGPVIRHKTGIEELPPMPAGIHMDQEAPVSDYAGLRLLPLPESWQPSGGALAFSGLVGDHPELMEVDALASRLTLAPLTDLGGTPITFAQDPNLPSEVYHLTISEDGLALAAADGTGVFYGLITLLVLRETHNGIIPCGEIRDNPRFAWRGLHLDCARHFFSIETIGRLIDMMSLFKFNRFHWHFADDEAFRVEIDSYPDLWKKSAFRGQGELVPGVFGGGIRSGGSYSKDAIRNLVAHAKSLHIEILPEIEFPAHSWAMGQIFPDLRDRGDNGQEASIQGYPQNTLNPAKPDTWNVIEAIADEIIDLFPFAHLHLGCDERPEGAWANSPEVNRLKEAENLTSGDDVQGWAMDRLARFVQDKGARPAAWEEAARGKNGGIGNNAILFSWTGTGPGIELAAAGYDIVMCPAQNIYLDMAHTSDIDDWGASWAAFVALKDTINWTPFTGDPEADAHIIGVQGTFWGEFTTQDSQFEPMIAPRILGVALMAWNPEHGLSERDFLDLAYSVAPIFDRIGWARHTGTGS